MHKYRNQFFPDGISEDFVFQVGKLKIARCLGFTFTNRCTATCSFCCNGSSPKGDIGLPLDTMLKLIQQAKEAGFVQIALSGGEPMVRMDDVLMIAECCHNLGITFTIATNGFWARNIEFTKSILMKLRTLGLTRIRTSYDEAHAEWIPSDRISNLLEVTKNLGIPISISSAFFKAGPRLADFLPASQLVDVEIYESPVIYSGRAKKISFDQFEFRKEPSKSVCPTPFQLVINYDGSVYPCCSVSGFNKNLLIGNAFKDNINTILSRLSSNLYLYYIQKQGFSEIIEKALTSKEYNELATLTVCEICAFICNEDERLFRFMQQVDISITEYLLEGITEIQRNRQQINTADAKSRAAD